MTKRMAKEVGTAEDSTIVLDDDLVVALDTELEKITDAVFRIEELTSVENDFGLVSSYGRQWATALELMNNHPFSDRLLDLREEIDRRQWLNAQAQQEDDIEDEDEESNLIRGSSVA